ncbi:MAG: VWA domain-containing protein [Limisphaerales bacterium]
MSVAWRLASPLWLLALLPLAGLAWWALRSRMPATLVFSSTRLLDLAGAGPSRGPVWWLKRMRLTALGLVVLALARPQIEKAETREDTRGINLVLALDFSGTMRTRDFLLDGRRLPRSEGMKRISAEFIQARTNDRVGLVSFDREAYVACPLTLDHQWVLERLKSETNGQGTAIGSALIVAAGHLQRHTNETRVVILMTDAENISAGQDPAEVAEAIRPLGIRVYGVQILSPGEPAPYADLSELLTHTAVRTGGEFFRVRTGEDLRAVYSQIDRLEKQKLTDRREKGWRELFPWLALPALGLLLTEQALAHTRWRRLP